jgi:hypothetical protein
MIAELEQVGGFLFAALAIWVACWLGLVMLMGAREEKRISSAGLKICPFCKGTPDARGFCCFVGQRGGAWQSDGRWHAWSDRP